MRQVCLAVFLVLGLTAIAGAQTKVDGKWTAEVAGGRGGAQQVTFNFKADGNKLTGTVTNGQAGEAPIEEGKIEGDTITFKQNLNFNGNAVSISYTGKVKGDQIEFTREAAGGGGGGGRGGRGGGPATFTAKRAS